MQYNRKMINGVVFLEEQADYLLLLGKEGLYTVQAENDHWNVHYTLPGDTSNLDKQFISKDEALQDVYEMDIWRRNRWKFLPMKELRTRLKKLLMESGMFYLYRKSQESHRGQKIVKHLAGLHFFPIY